MTNVLAGRPSPGGGSKNKQPLSRLPIGTRVKSIGTFYYNLPLVFIIGDKTDDRVKLVTERIIALKPFDAREPLNPDSNRKASGNNRYSQSNIDQWLNKDNSPWFVSSHDYDQSPSNIYVWNNYNGYDTEIGFLSNFDKDFKNSILDSDIIIAKNISIDGGGSETITRKIYLLSNTEAGLANENGIVEGKKWDMFTNDSSRMVKPTTEAVSRSTYKISGLNADSPWQYWLRTPDTKATATHQVYGVTATGILFPDNAYSSGLGGIRPAIELSSRMGVSTVTDSDGCYMLVF